MPKYLFSPNKMFKTILNKLYTFFLDIFSPKYCLLCLKWSPNYFCQVCLKKINFEPQITCLFCEKRLSFDSVCKQHSRPIRKLISFGIYEESPLKEKIILAKNNGYREVFYDLGKEIGEKIKNFNWQGFQLAFIPLTRKKYFLRGFNQAEALAQGIQEILRLPIFDGIIKIKETKDQAELNFEERKTNLKAAFKLNKKPGEKILLIDDIKTTGTTLAEVAQILKKEGTKEIIALTILR